MKKEIEDHPLFWSELHTPTLLIVMITIIFILLFHHCTTQRLCLLF